MAKTKRKRGRTITLKGSAAMSFAVQAMREDERLVECGHAEKVQTCAAFPNGSHRCTCCTTCRELCREKLAR